MKRFFTFLLWSMALLACPVQAQDIDESYVFMDDNGNILENGATVVRSDIEIDDATGAEIINSGIWVLNVAGGDDYLKVHYVINRIDNGTYQICFPSTCNKTLRTDDGKIVLSWLRGERVAGEFSYQLHLQIFDAEGNAMFGDEGIIVCDKRTRTWTTDYALALASNGDILLGYTDIRNDPNEENAESYLYRYTQQGNPVWGADGIMTYECCLILTFFQ